MERKETDPDSWLKAGRKTRLIAAGLLLLLAASCSRNLVPVGEPAERSRARAAEGVYSAPLAKRPLPALQADAALPRVLQYAFTANGEIEAAYRDWRGAIERVVQAGALADPRLEFSFMFDADNFQSFTGVLKSFRLMASQELPAKGKRPAKGAQALAEAQASGERFRAAKFALQRKVVQAYADLSLNGLLIGQTSETLRLLRQSREVALHRYHEGTDTVLADLRKLDVEIQTAQSDQNSLRIQEQGLAATLNGLLNRPPEAPLGPVRLPELQWPADSDAELFARAVRANPDLAALRKEIEAKGAAQVLAELERKPDYTVNAGLEGLLSPTVGVGMTLPINRERIRAMIAESLAMRQAAEARLRAAQSDTLARVVLALVSLRDAERILDNYHRQIIPRTKELLDSQLATYGSGGGEVLDILDTERMLIDFRKLVLRAESDRLRAAAALEETIGEDLFKFIPASKGEGAGEAAK